ncbi:hypothetical protein TV01_0728 [Neisseria flavescens]|nr:hypothetical protein TV01_0728 [Neisseria flavescens]
MVRPYYRLKQEIYFLDSLIITRPSEKSICLIEQED